MASPLDALGAAAAILQLVQFGIQLSEKTMQIYKSGQGLTREAEDVSIMTTKFRDMNMRVMAKCDSNTTSRTNGMKEIVRTARECDKVAQDLLQALDSMRPAGPSSLSRSLMAAVKSERRKGVIDAHLQRLKSLRQLLNEQILRLVNDNTSSTARTLRDLDRAVGALSSDLASHKQELVDAIRSHSYSQVQIHLDQMTREGEVLLFRRDVLASLRYKEILWRRERIAKASENTAEWIFCSSQNPPLRFVEWLERDSGIFWITGKAGSGKSTLMKYVYNHPRTQACLQTWARGRRLVTGSHYFWYLGKPIERSYRGLLQSILYETLRACPALIDVVCASWDRADVAGYETMNNPWTISELTESVASLADPDLRVEGSPLSFCFFVDGFDEYEGEHDEVIAALRQVCKSDHVKFCISSRPWEVFQQSFARDVELGNTLTLQNHTKPDILAFVEEEIGKHLIKRDGRDDELTSLKSEIVEKAQGVFLWVALVIKKELKPGLMYGDDLRKRLQQIPPELEGYFRLIFERIDPFYWRESARIFLTCMHATEPLRIEAVPLIMDDHPESIALNVTPGQGSDAHLFEKVRKQVNGRCQDLLEVDNTGGWDTIQFLHKSVQDYLGQREMWKLLHDRAGSDFSAQTTLLAAYVFFIAAESIELTNLQMVMDLATTGLLYATEVAADSTSRALLQRLDSAMTVLHESRKKGAGHWTNTAYDYRVTSPSLPSPYNDSPEFRSPAYPNHDKQSRDFLGHIIELGLTSHACAMLRAQPAPHRMKQGRPYLDYALRQSPLAEIVASRRPNLEIVKVLLSQGCKANERVPMYDNRTIWDLYIAHLCADRRLANDETLMHSSKQAAWMLIDHGAITSGTKVHGKSNAQIALHRSTTSMLQTVFGEAEADMMMTAMRSSSTSWSEWFKWW